MTMKQTLATRLAALKSEHEAGQRMLEELETKRQSLTRTVLRIEGAIEVLQEMIASSDGERAPSDAERG